MDLYFSPLACSMATRIALNEIGETANFIEVDPKTKRVLLDDSDYRVVNPLGLVPVVRTDEGVVLTENAAILQYVAETFPESGIGAKSGLERTRLQQWLCFIGTELHKSLFTPLLDRKAPPEVKAYTLEKNLSRLEHLNKHLEGREFLLDHFSVADAYLTTVLNWSQATPQIDFSKYPAVTAYLDRMRKRPSVAKALGEEVKLFQAEIARHKAA
ncbi:MAG: glutathione S-transferase [Proteobacteria bacterium SG_bin9]|nr:MAG: glutathione S-transferase [Proteobacteria bacterium SG_bin9]